MDSSKLLQALREETLPKLKPAREALEAARSTGKVEELEPVRELLHKVSGTAAVAGLPALTRLARLGEDVALLALEGDAKPAQRLFHVLDSVLGAIESDLSPPKAPAHAAGASVETRPPPEPASAGRVVVASDENVSAKLLLKLLEEVGFSPRRISIADAAERLPDCELLLLDVPSAEGARGGVDAALANGAKHRLPVLVTVKGETAPYAARANAVLPKPVRPEELEQTVRSLVDRRRAIAAARAKAPTGQAPSPPQPAAPIKVLIVDDSRVIRGVVREALAEVGVIAIEAEDGSEALKVFDATSPDAVISDLQMPGVEGTELIPLLRARSKRGRVPIVVLSALEDEGSRKAGLAAGADAYLVKSIIDGPALLAALKAAGLALP